MAGSARSNNVASITVSKLLLKYLELENVRLVFGVPGAAIKHVLDDLKDARDRFTYVVTKHESGAGFMADGYYRVSGDLGVVLVTSGPGATNALTATMNAQAGFSSLLTITGEISEQYYGMGWEQEGVDADLNVKQIYAHAADYSAVITAGTNFQTLMHQALREARGIPAQAAHISLPDDIAASELENVELPASPANYRSVTHGHDMQQTVSALDALLAAKRPLIFLGNGCRQVLRSGRLAEFRDFVERFAIPVMTTPDAKALFPESHELSLRVFGVAGCEWPALYMDPPAGADGAEPYDCLLVLGSTLAEFSTNRFDPVLRPAGPIIQVDANASVLAKSMLIDEGIIAEIGAFIDDLTGRAAERKPDKKAVEARRKFLSRLKKQHSAYRDPKARKSSASPIRPERVMAQISELLPEGGHIFVDAGNSCGWSTHYLEIDAPSQVHASLAVGSMGYAVCGVVGGKLADPDATCVAICGDGGFMMHGTEVSTASQYNVGAIWVVWCDNDLSMVSQGMNYFFPDPKVWDDYYQIGNPDLVKFAESLGAKAYSVKTPDEMEKAFKKAIAGGQGKKGKPPRPQVIVVHHDPKPLPPFYPKDKAKSAAKERTAITGAGYALPKDVRKNDDPIFDWIKENDPDYEKYFDGYEERRVLADGETIIDIMLPAAERALADAGVGADEVDILTGYASISEFITPNALSEIHDKLGLRTECWLLPIADDFTNALSGLLISNALIESGRARNALGVCGCNWTRYSNYHKRQAVSSSDGAGALVLGRTADGSCFSIVDAITSVEPKAYGAMKMRAERLGTLDGQEAFSKPWYDINQQGLEQFMTFGKDGPPALINKLLDRNGLHGTEITLFTHQASSVLSKHWKDVVGPAQYPNTLAELANMTLASLPVNFALKKDEIRKDYVVFSGVGPEFQTTALLLRRGS